MRRAPLALVALIATLVGLVGLVGPTQASEHQLRGFNGHATGAATFVPDPACTTLSLRTVSTATGTASQLGPVTMSAVHCSGDHIAGTMTLTGSRGTVTLRYEGDCTPYQPGVTLVECETHFVVTGGSGRYAGATGSGHLCAVVLPQTGSTPWPATFTWKGRIRY